MLNHAVLLPAAGTYGLCLSHNNARNFSNKPQPSDQGQPAFFNGLLTAGPIFGKNSRRTGPNILASSRAEWAGQWIKQDLQLGIVLDTLSINVDDRADEPSRGPDQLKKLNVFKRECVAAAIPRCIKTTDSATNDLGIIL